MPTISLTTRIRAPIETVFDLSRSIDLHLESASATEERVIGGRRTGLIELGETVTWEARHFGLKFRLTSKVVICDRPRHFRDSMIEGPFRHFDHDHFFESDGETTVVTDEFTYSSPLGVLGRLADRLFLERHMRLFLQERNAVLARVGESGDLQRFFRSTGS